MAQRLRPRITVTVDPDMLQEVDTYIREHEGVDRSQVVDEALRVWYGQILHEALVRQHATAKSPEERQERSAWKRIRAAQMPRLGLKYTTNGES